MASNGGASVTFQNNDTGAVVASRGLVGGGSWQLQPLDGWNADEMEAPVSRILPSLWSISEQTPTSPPPPPSITFLESSLFIVCLCLLPLSRASQTEQGWDLNSDNSRRLSALVSLWKPLKVSLKLLWKQKEDKCANLRILERNPGSSSALERFRSSQEQLCNSESGWCFSWKGTFSVLWWTGHVYMF